MKYKVGDEVLVKVQIVEEGIYGYGLKTPDGILFTAKRDSVFPIPTMTAEEAWELARRIEMLSTKEINEIFGYLTPVEVINNFPHQEAKDMIEALEAEKEIKVGDVVIETSEAGNKYIGVVTQITSAQNSVCMAYYDGSVGITLAKRLKKTGRHINIDEILKQIGGDE